MVLAIERVIYGRGYRMKAYIKTVKRRMRIFFRLAEAENNKRSYSGKQRKKRKGFGGDGSDNSGEQKK